MWLESYLTGQTQSVKIEGQASKPKCLCCCVPQGSVLGPKSYCIYCRPIGRIAKRYGLSYHCFADDSQLYIILNSLSAWFNTASNIQECLKEIQLWMEINMLKMNEDKTEFIIFTPRSSKINTSHLSLQVGLSNVTPAKVVKNLGSLWDNHLKMDKQIAAICRSSYYHLRAISRI